MILKEKILKKKKMKLKCSLGAGDKEKKKRNFISRIVMGVYKLNLSDRDGYFHYSLRAFKEGNTFFMNYRRYDSQYGIFEKEYSEKLKPVVKTIQDETSKLAPAAVTSVDSE